MDKDKCKARLRKLWDDMEVTGDLPSATFMEHHNYVSKVCIASPGNVAIVIECATELLREKAPLMQRDRYMLLASHLHGVCAFIARFHTGDGQDTLYQLAERESARCQ